MRGLLHFFLLATITFVTISCNSYSITSSIIKVETEYDSDCVNIDTCIKTIKTYYSDGSTENIFYIKYPTVKTITRLDSSEKFISELQVLDNDSVLNTMYYDIYGNEEKYVRKHLTKQIPDLVTIYKNRYDKLDRIIYQTEYKRQDEVKSSKAFYYDTLGYSMLVVEKEGENGDTLSVFHYNGKHLALEKKVNRGMSFEFQYDQNGLLVFEDVTFMPQIRKFYSYSNGLLSKITEEISHMGRKNIW